MQEKEKTRAGEKTRRWHLIVIPSNDISFLQNASQHFAGSTSGGAFSPQCNRELGFVKAQRAAGLFVSFVWLFSVESS